MTSTFSPSPDWTLANRYIVAADGTLRLGNTGGHDIRWFRTTDDLLPTTPPGMAHLLRPGLGHSAQFKAGDRIWLAANPSGTALIDPMP